MKTPQVIQEQMIYHFNEYTIGEENMFGTETIKGEWE